MLVVGDVLVSQEIITKQFCCDIKICKGSCCYEGDGGAPLTRQERSKIKAIVPVVKKFLSTDEKRELDINGFSEKNHNVLSVSLRKNGECVFAIKKNGIYSCAIQQAFFEKKQDEIEKPISCHLYPIRISKTAIGEVLNYHSWEICSPALSLGKRKALPLYTFLKEALTKKYGKEWYAQLLEITRSYLKTKKDE